jgi:hypothetical protein
LLSLDDNGPDLSAKTGRPRRHHDSDVHEIGVQIRSGQNPDISLDTIVRTVTGEPLYLRSPFIQAWSRHLLDGMCDLYVSAVGAGNGPAYEYYIFF